MIRLLSFISIFAALMMAPAFAWQASSEGPDVFGTIKVIASELGPREGLVVQCDSKEDLYVAYIFKKKEFEDIPNTPAVLYLQGSSKDPIKLDSTLRTWNDNFAGVVAYGRDPDLLRAVTEIETAKGKLNVGYEAFGGQFSASFSSRGSTKAMQRVFDGCKLSEIASPPA